ncbi:UNVERIFIED_CONTAM: hypothetical protein Sradi_0751600 [Sesamum radiatum]|uniref:Uncharacterized protein n=1 Tax=Sesamum radiatum TaxID=300843 RepID=A0AAW2VQ69_SESRA
MTGIWRHRFGLGDQGDHNGTVASAVGNSEGKITLRCDGRCRGPVVRRAWRCTLVAMAALLKRIAQSASGLCGCTHGYMADTKQENNTRAIFG